MKKSPLDIGLHSIEEYPAIRKKILDQIHKEKLPPFEDTILLPDHRRIPVEISAIKIQIWNQDIVECIFHDISERKIAEQEITKRLRHEYGVAEFSRALFGSSLNPLLTALKTLINTVDTSRIHLFENCDVADSGLGLQQICEICAPNVKSFKDLYGNQPLLYSKGFNRWQETLSRRDSIKGLVKDFPLEEQHYFEVLGIKSFHALPVYSKKRWIGFISFDDCLEEHLWDEEDIRLLQAAANMIGYYLLMSRE